MTEEQLQEIERASLLANIPALIAEVRRLRAESERVERMRTRSRIYCHIAPDQTDIASNRTKEPEGERLRQELTEWLEKNGVVSMLLDTPNHAVTVDIRKLPRRIKHVLTVWGSLYTIDRATETSE